MKRVLILLLSAVLMTAALTGCSSGEEDALVSKTPFPEFSEVDIAGDEISSDIFADYDATIVNFWNNGCGSCIAEMPELEELYQDFKERNINLIGVGTDSGESREQLDTAREILKEKGVTYHNISPDPEGDFYKDFVADISTYPTTYIVDSEGKIVVADIVGKYGLVPKEAMPETYSSEHTAQMAALLKLKLREYGLSLREAARDGAEKAELESRKTEMLGGDLPDARAQSGRAARALHVDAARCRGASGRYARIHAEVVFRNLCRRRSHGQLCHADERSHARLLQVL